MAGDFSISDAKNEAGEWIMSPEQIRAEMAASLEWPAYCDQCGICHIGDCFEYDDWEDEPED